MPGRMSVMRPSALTRLFKTGTPREVARLPDRALRVVDSTTKLRGFRRPRLPGWMRKHAGPLLTIVLPTLLATIYYVAFAADQYASEARYIIRGQQSSAGSLFGQLMSSVSITTSQEDLLSVGDYLQSHDALKALQGKIALKDMFTRPEADYFARLRSGGWLGWGGSVAAEDF